MVYAKATVAADWLRRPILRQPRAMCTTLDQRCRAAAPSDQPDENGGVKYDGRARSRPVGSGGVRNVCHGRMLAMLAVGVFSMMGIGTMSAQAAGEPATLSARQRLQRVAQVVRQPSRSAVAIRTASANEVLLGIPSRYVERISPREFYYGMPGPDRKLEYEVHLSCAGEITCGRYTLAINIVPPTDLRISDVERMFGRRLYPSPNLRELAHAPETLAPGSGAGTYESVERGSLKGLAHIRVELGVGGLVSNVAVEGR